MRNKALISAHSLVPERGFAAYEREYRRGVRDYEAVSSLDELRAALHDSSVIFVGDYHTHKQSQRAYLRLLRWMVADQVPGLVMGLEIVRDTHQAAVDDFLSGRMREKDFLRKIRFREYWYFDLWEHFRPLFDFAREHRIPVVGIEKYSSTHVSLARRDLESSRLVGDYLETHPDARMMILTGDLHIAPTHLPAAVLKEMKGRGLSCQPLILYQNCEEIYWKLAQDDLEHRVEVVRVRPREYALMTTPPIVWQQSFLNWLEHEEGGIDFEDAKHSFLDILTRMARFLEIELPQEAEEVEVYTCGDLSFLKWLTSGDVFSRSDIRRIKAQILSSESYCIPKKKIVYLGNLSLNHAGEEAAHILKLLCSGPEDPRDLRDAFYAAVWQAALGFFGSKIINHKRKCLHPEDYENLEGFLRTSRGLDSRGARLILQHARNGGRELPDRYFQMPPALFLKVTQGLGFMLGEKLYHGLLSRRVSKREVREIFYDSMRDDGDPLRLYRRFQKKLQGLRIPKRV